MSKALAKALDRRSKANDNITRVLKRDYPVRRKVTWRKNGLHSGHVLDHDYGDRIKVANKRTKNAVWISAYDIVEAMGK